MVVGRSGSNRAFPSMHRFNQADAMIEFACLAALVCSCGGVWGGVWGVPLPSHRQFRVWAKAANTAFDEGAKRKGQGMLGTRLDRSTGSLIEGLGLFGRVGRCLCLPLYCCLDRSVGRSVGRRSHHPSRRRRGGGVGKRRATKRRRTHTLPIPPKPIPHHNPHPHTHAEGQQGPRSESSMGREDEAGLATAVPRGPLPAPVP